MFESAMLPPTPSLATSIGPVLESLSIVGTFVFGASGALAAARLRQAVFAEPFMVAGTDRFCTDFMVATAPRVFVKTGAEGVFCAAVPAYGLGVALKCDDGAGRAAWAARTCTRRPKKCAAKAAGAAVRSRRSTVFRPGCAAPVSAGRLGGLVGSGSTRRNWRGKL